MKSPTLVLLVLFAALFAVPCSSRSNVRIAGRPPALSSPDDLLNTLHAVAGRLTPQEVLRAVDGATTGSHSVTPEDSTAFKSLMKVLDQLMSAIDEGVLRSAGMKGTHVDVRSLNGLLSRVIADASIHGNAPGGSIANASDFLNKILEGIAKAAVAFADTGRGPAAPAHTLKKLPSKIINPTPAPSTVSPAPVTVARKVLNDRSAASYGRRFQDHVHGGGGVSVPR